MMIYTATHSLPRTSIVCADADAIVQRVNSTTAASGDSIHRDRVQAELDAIASHEQQALMQIGVLAVGVDE